MDASANEVQRALDLAASSQRAGRLVEAEEACRHVMRLQPASSAALNVLGVVLCQMGRIGEGAQELRRASELDPTNPACRTNLGNALAALGDIDGAVASYRQALALRPDLPDAWNNLGNALQEKHDASGAVAAHHRAIELRPSYAQACYNLGGAYKLAGHNDEAIAAYERAIAIDPAYAKAMVNRANILKDIGRLDEAIVGYEQAMKLVPSPVTAGNLIYCLYFHPAYDSARIFEQLVQWNRLFAAPLGREIRPHENDRTPGRRLRIGYVSPDFSEHPAGRFLLPLLQNHDHARFEIYCYSDLRTPDAMTTRLRACADFWRDTFALHDAQLAEQIRQDRIDILVDLSQHLANNRLLTFARKPAPVQVTWLGYPGSTGLTTIDYRLTDAHLDPPGLFDRFYSEKTIRLPDCYWCYQPLVDAIDAGPLPALEKSLVTFGCLNNFAKVTDPIMELWARVMGRCAGSRLLILTPIGSARARFLDRMANHGIVPDRIEFVDRMSRPQYMATYRRIVVSLDTWPCNGHTTSFDSIWMGVPLVTLTGQTAMSRGGASILNNLGLGDLVADDPEGYVQKAAELAGDLTRLQSLRAGLRGRIERSPLMDAVRFARNVESAFYKMWQEWRRPPAT